MPKTLRSRLTKAVTSRAKADRALATYMLAEFANLPFETAASLAAKVDVSEPTVGRFCRGLGYDGFKDLKNSLRDEMGDEPWLIGDRVSELRARTDAGQDRLTRGLELEIAALVTVYEAANTPEWAQVVRRLARASSVLVAGFHKERGIAHIFTHHLQSVRDRVHMLDLETGNFAGLLASNDPDIALVLFAARPYVRNAVLLAHEAKARNIPVTLITDPYCDWGHGVADDIFVVPTSFNLIWESTAQMASLANLLVNGVFLELDPSGEARMIQVADIYSKFAGSTAPLPKGIKT